MSDAKLLILCNFVVAIGALVIPLIKGFFDKQRHINNSKRQLSIEKALVITNAETAHHLNVLTRLGESTHVLVNSNMEKQLRLNMLITKRLANMTKDPQDEEAAHISEETYLQHMQQQARSETITEGA